MLKNNINNNNNFDYFEFSLKGDVLKTKNDFRNFYSIFVVLVSLVNILVFDLSFSLNILLIVFFIGLYLLISVFNFIFKNYNLFSYIHIVENIVSSLILISIMVYFYLYLSFFNEFNISYISRISLVLTQFFEEIGCPYIIGEYNSFVNVVNNMFFSFFSEETNVVFFVKSVYFYSVESYNLTFDSLVSFFVYSFFLLNAFGIILSRNPINSLLFLIATYVYSSIVLLAYGLELFALLYVIIYVGAIAVLFLFVIMMLKFEKIPEYKLKKSGLFNFFLFFLFLSLFIIFFKSYNSNLLINLYYWRLNEVVRDSSLENYFNLRPILNDLEDLGMVFYTKYSFAFIMSGLVLLVSIVAPILLTFRERRGVKKQYHSDQLSRTKEKIISLKDI